MRGVRVPTPRSVNADVDRRLYDLERAVKANASSSRPVEEPELIVFSQGGDATAVSTSEVSGRYYPLRRGKLAFVLCTLTTAGSSSTVVSIKKNGSEITTVTLASSDTFEAKTLATTFSVGVDYLTVAATTAGTGAEGLTVQARFV